MGLKEMVGEAVVGFLVGFGDTVGAGVPFEARMDTSVQLEKSDAGGDCGTGWGNATEMK